MAAADYIVFLGSLIGGLAVALLPYAAALVVARIRRLPSGYSFASLCTVLTYGITVAAVVLQAPLQAAATQLAPTWHAIGHRTIANAVGSCAEYLGYATVLVPLATSVACPWWLHKRWSSVLLALRANNSSKPTPLRGAA